MGRTHDVAVGGKWAGGRGENTEGSLAIASFGADGCQRGLSRLATFSSHLVDLDGLPSSQRSSIASAASCWHPSLSAAWRVRRMYVHLEAVGLQNCLWWAAGPQKRADRQWRDSGCRPLEAAAYSGSTPSPRPPPPPDPNSKPCQVLCPPLWRLAAPSSPRRSSCFARAWTKLVRHGCASASAETWLPSPGPGVGAEASVVAGRHSQSGAGERYGQIG